MIDLQATWMDFPATLCIANITRSQRYARDHQDEERQNPPLLKAVIREPKSHRDHQESHMDHQEEERQNLPLIQAVIREHKSHRDHQEIGTIRRRKDRTLLCSKR
jgi:hypothetical protein